jgi:hypothetical protein
MGSAPFEEGLGAVERSAQSLRELLAVALRHERALSRRRHT